MKFGTGVHQSKGLLDVVYMDIWGPTKTALLGGRWYFVSFVDDFSRRN